MSEAEEVQTEADEEFLKAVGEVVAHLKEASVLYEEALKQLAVALISSKEVDEDLALALLSTRLIQAGIEDIVRGAGVEDLSEDNIESVVAYAVDRAAEDGEDLDKDRVLESARLVI